MESKKYSEYNIKEADTDIEKKLVVTSGEWGRGNIGVRQWEVQTIGCKIGSRMYCTTRGI